MGDRVRLATEHVDTQFFRALTVLRAVTIVYTLSVNAARWQDFSRPALAWALLALMVLWSAAATWLYDQPHRRRDGVFVADLVVALALLGCTPLVAPAEVTIPATLPSFWVATSVLACAVRWGAIGGFVAAVLVSVVDVSIRSEVSLSAVGNVFLLVIAGALVGYCIQTVRAATVARAEAERRAATAGERERLARAVHDGVLQVLAMVQRRGAEIGGETADLARLAGEQEVALRSLIQTSVDEDSAGVDQVADLGVALRSLSSPRVTVSTPSRPVSLSRGVVDELVAVVRACDDNVRRHVGADAPMWVLLEDDPGEVVVSVRDEGPGIEDGRLDDAAAEGRLGVVSSIRGRVEDLGGRAELTTGPGQGTEWELRLPAGTVRA